MVETEITNILEDYIDNDEDYFKVVDFIENQDKMLYAKNNTNKILIKEKKELQDRIDKLVESILKIDTKNEILELRIDKAIELIEHNIKATKMLLDDYMLHKEHNKILIELLKEDLEHEIYILDILRGEDNE